MTIATATCRASLVLLLVRTDIEAAKYAKICALPSMLDAVELKHGGPEGFFVVEDGGAAHSNGDKSNDTTMTAVSAGQTTTRGGEEQTYLALPCPCDDFKRTYCMIDGSGPTPDSCGVAYSNPHDVFITRDDNMTRTSYYNNSGRCGCELRTAKQFTDLGMPKPATLTDIGCFKFDQETMFVRNAW